VQGVILLLFGTVEHVGVILQPLGQAFVLHAISEIG
jgi:hypothetical protein